MKKLVVVVILLFIFCIPVYPQEKDSSIDHQIQILRLQLENASLRKQLAAKQFVELKALERQLIGKISELSRQKKEQNKKTEDPKKEIDEEIRE